MKIPVLQDPSDAMREASKMQAHEVWLPNGALSRRSQEFPLEQYTKETIYSVTGLVFEGWSRKVVVLTTVFFQRCIIALDCNRNS